MLTGESLQADARQLLQDIPLLQEWHRVRNPSNKVRDAMLKLGTLWDVPRQVEGMRRPPAEVAQEIEENMLKRAKKILIGSAGAQRKIYWLPPLPPTPGSWLRGLRPQEQY